MLDILRIWGCSRKQQTQQIPALEDYILVSGHKQKLAQQHVSELCIMCGDECCGQKEKEQRKGNWECQGGHQVVVIIVSFLTHILI